MAGATSRGAYPLEEARFKARRGPGESNSMEELLGRLTQFVSETSAKFVLLKLIGFSDKEVGQFVRTARSKQSVEVVAHYFDEKNEDGVTGHYRIVYVRHKGFFVLGQTFEEAMLRRTSVTTIWA